MNINNLTKKQKNLLLRVIAAAVMLVVLYLLPLEEYPVLRFVLFMIPYLTVGNDVLRKAWKGIRNHQVFDECFLMAVATVGAMILGEYTEAVAVMLFYQIGELFQSIAVGKSRRSISELMDIRPDYANLEQDGEVEKVDPDEVEVGSIIVIRPGEKVPIDGVVVEGISSLNTSALTGESLPRDVKPGDEIISGSVNISGLLRVETTKEFDESTASKILELVENAGERKAKSEQFISKFARWYTPAVCYGALALAILGPLVNILVFHKTSDGALWSDWIYRALTFLVISCPCAIVVSVPLSFFGGIGGASREGILIKGSNFMETLANVKYMVMDKTGTITKGNFEVTAVHDGGDQNMDPTEILELAAHAEGHSTHPIAVSIRRAYETDGRALDMNRVTDVQEISGKGLVATVDGMQIAAGNLKLMEQLGIKCEPCRRVGTVVYVAKKEAENPAAAGLAQFEYIGHVLISDEIKPTSAEAIRAMKKAGVMKTVMLTGDITSMAKSVAEEVGIDEVHAELLPEDKVSLAEKLMEEKAQKAGTNATLAFVGDGINDAPVLAIADLGIAMGALGSDAAIEAADVVLMDDDPMKISKAIRIARKCIRIVNENIWFAIGVKLACLLGIANMWVAIFADVGVMVLCVLNAVRALLVEKV